jgi:hypothetical protein
MAIRWPPHNDGEIGKCCSRLNNESPETSNRLPWAAGFGPSYIIERYNSRTSISIYHYVSRGTHLLTSVTWPCTIRYATYTGDAFRCLTRVQWFSGELRNVMESGRKFGNRPNMMEYAGRVCIARGCMRRLCREPSFGTLRSLNWFLVDGRVKLLYSSRRDIYAQGVSI